jgi:hypothetical protein
VEVGGGAFSLAAVAFVALSVMKTMRLNTQAGFRS